MLDLQRPERPFFLGLVTEPQRAAATCAKNSEVAMTSVNSNSVARFANYYVPYCVLVYSVQTLYLTLLYNIVFNERSLTAVSIFRCSISRKAQYSTAFTFVGTLYIV